jgi:O-antigen ligase
VAIAGATGLIPLDTIFSRWEGGLHGLTRSRSKIHEVGLEMWTESVKTMAIGAGHATFALTYTEQAGRSQDLGAGLGRDAHNQWVKSLGELGAVGFVLIAALMVAMLYVAARSAPGYAMVSWGVIGMLAIASMSASLDYHKITWYSIILVASIARVTPKAPRAVREDPILAEYHLLRGTS